MADPQLKPATPAGAPRRVLLNTGAAPTRRVTLLGANGQSIAQKTPTPAPVATPPPATMPAPAAATPAPAPEPQVDEEALRAQQEYERQMEEYNRQMEEYNRQMAEYEAQVKAAEEAAAAAATPAPEPEPAPQPTPAPTLSAARPAGGPKLSVARPAGAPATGPKLSVARPGAAPAAGPKLSAARPGAAPAKRPAAAAAPAPEASPEEAAEAPAMTDAQQQQRQAYLEKLQKLAEKKPFHKRPPFYIGLGILLAISIGGYFYVSSHNAEVEKAQALQKAQQELLARSGKPGAKFSAEEIDLLVHIVLNPEEKDEHGNYLYNSAQGPLAAAENAAAILGQEAANDSKIYDRVFKLLAKDVTKLHKRMLNTMLERLVKAHPKGLNDKLNTLIKGLQENFKEQKAQDTAETIFNYKRNLINAKTAKKDLELVIPMFCDENVKDKLRLELHYYILQIFRDGKLSDNTKKDLGNKIFTALSGKDKMLDSAYTCKVLGTSGSDKALAHYKAKMKDKKKWKDYKSFFEEWQDPAILSELITMRDSCDLSNPEEEKQAGTMNSILFGIAFAERDMTTEEARTLLRTIYQDYDVDITPLKALEDKRKSNTKLEGEELKQWQQLSAALTHRYNLIKHLSTFSEEYQWVTDLLKDERAYFDAIPGSSFTDRCRTLSKAINDAPDKIKANKAEKAERELNVAKTEKKS